VGKKDTLTQSYIPQADMLSPHPLKSWSPLNSQSRPQKNKGGALTLSDFKTCFKAIVMKMWYSCKDTHINKQTRMESSDISPHTGDQTVFDKTI
jgi:hypothetical protein